MNEVKLAGLTKPSGRSADLSCFETQIKSLGRFRSVVDDFLYNSFLGNYCKSMAKTQKIEPSKLTSHLGYWLRQVSNNVSYSFARKLDESGVTVAEWVILREMYSRQGTTSLSAIAELTGLTRGAVSKLISRLLEKRLVHRSESSDDRRYQDIELTAKAAALVPKLAGLADQNDEEFFSCLTKAERNQLRSLLQKIVAKHEITTVPIE